MATFTRNAKGMPLIHFELENGYTVSICLRWHNNSPCNLSLAAWRGEGRIINGGSEATDEEAVKFLAMIAAKPASS